MSQHGSTASGIVAAFILSILSVVEPVLAAQRTFVSTTGSDGSATCSLAAPCRGLAKALTLTDPGGEIIVLESGGYGAVTIDKSVSINSPAGVYAGISVFAATDGVTVVAPATKVVLRGLTINGQGGNNGIRLQAGEVHIENVVVSNMGQSGILIEGGTSVRISGTVVRSNGDGLRVVPGSGAVSVLVRDSEFANNLTAGIGVPPSAAGTSALVTVEHSTLTRNLDGVLVAPSGSATATLVLTQSVVSENSSNGVRSQGAGATVFVRESAITRNGTGLLQGNSGLLTACGANLLVANGTAQSGVVTVNAAACLDQVAGGGAGTVTSVGTGAGLTGGPITTSGTINLASTQLLPAVSCANKQIARWNGSAWLCDVDYDSGGTVTSITAGSGLTGGTITGSGTIAVDPTSTTLTGNFFTQGGNAFGAPAILGTTDNQPLTLLANNQPVLRLVPASSANITNAVNVVNGSPLNNALPGAAGATIAGGGGTNAGTPAPNQVGGDGATVGGGFSNTATNNGTVAGGLANTATSTYGAVGGGLSNAASGGLGSTVGGGSGNMAAANSSTVSGGDSNRADGNYSAVGGGSTNDASGVHATVSGGVANIASGARSTVPGGFSNVASGDDSFAAGRRAKTQNSTGTIIHNGTFAFADGNDFEFYTSAANEFAVRATGGVRFVTALNGSGNPTRTFRIGSDGTVTIPIDLVNPNPPQTNILLTQAISSQHSRVRFQNIGSPFYWDIRGGGANTDLAFHRSDVGTDIMILTPGQADLLTMSNGAHLTSGGAWTNASDRNAKENFGPVDPRDVLAQVVALPVTQWNYKAEPGIKRIGPMAQDFHAAFRVGADDMSISTVDEGGVALAAIQGLYAELRDRDAKIADLGRELAALKNAVASLTASGAIVAARKD